ncbi:uncharacterized protein MYCGRDRAFT_97689 [Zymoseptoria tritici IPO323]|uniref:Uncharacterized protein n=1 Tax=Zymoseptoria tritici (strain CBS 115943 / IPO323) TaxID=336722 RepID=F9XR03_ZYMTI|nr:uncharacterized protein MYCGRDRAFT_97689 [Zymoseptoria tritici IPO323]EGP82320.1 hypothetical protein MYCGRDRAFT_97689 [Zymoseptoria tritici IPO323]
MFRIPSTIQPRWIRSNFYPDGKPYGRSRTGSEHGGYHELRTPRPTVKGSSHVREGKKYKLEGAGCGLDNASVDKFVTNSQKAEEERQRQRAARCDQDTSQPQGQSGQYGQTQRMAPFLGGPQLPAISYPGSVRHPRERADYNRFWYAQAARIKQEMVEHLDRRAKQKSEDQSTPGFEPTPLPQRSRPLEVWPTVLSTSRCQPQTEPQSTQNTDPQSAQNTDPQSAQNTDPQSSQNTDPQSIKNTNPQSSDIKDYKHYRIIAERRSFGVEIYTTGLTDQTGPTTYTARTESTSHQHE